jgi:hypothetical protein
MVRMVKLSTLLLVGVIAFHLLAMLSCIKPDRKIDIKQIRNLSLDVQIWSCDDEFRARQWKIFLFHEAYRKLKAKFPQWNISNYLARSSAEYNRYCLEISVTCCGINSTGTPGFCMDVRIWAPGGNTFQKYGYASKTIEGDDFGKVVTTVNEFIDTLGD